MDKFLSGLEKFIMPVAEKLSTNRYLSAISKGLMMNMPILMIGSIASIFLNLPITGYQSVITGIGIKGMLSAILAVTTNMIALYASFTIAYRFISNEKLDGTPGGVISIVAFLTLNPILSVKIDEKAKSVFDVSWFGAKGLFVAMIVAIVVGVIYTVCLKKKLYVKMPDGVPKFVSDSFVAIIPGAISVFLFALVAMIFSKTSFGTMHQAVYSMIQGPLQGLGNTVWAVVLVYILEGICWFFGVHAIAVAAVVLPLWMAADAENLAAAAQGIANSNLPNIVTWSWVNTVSGVGGAGATLGLIIWMLRKAKSEQYKTLGKIAAPASLFNINEPIIFGIPCVLNPILFIPFVFTQPICVAIAYFLTYVGILPHPSGVSASSGVPIIIQGFLVGGWRIALWQVVCIFISLGVYYPFFRLLDKKALEEEQVI